MAKIPIAEFMAQTGKKKHQVHYLFRTHKRLKAQVKGEKSSRVDMDIWNRILKSA